VGDSAANVMAGRNAKPTTVSRLSAADQRQFDYYFYEGLRLKDNQKPDEALQMYRYCLSLDSLNGGWLCITTRHTSSSSQQQ
jgi:hypothetical protein